MRNCKGSKNPESFMVSAEVKQKERKKINAKTRCNCWSAKRSGVPFFLCQVFELGPSVNVVELRKSNGDPALYRQVTAAKQLQICSCH